MSSGWLAITKASSLDNSREWVLNNTCQFFPDSTDSRLRFTAKGLPGTVTQAVTKDRAVFIPPFF